MIKAIYIARQTFIQNSIVESSDCESYRQCGFGRHYGPRGVALDDNFMRQSDFIELELRRQVPLVLNAQRSLVLNSLCGVNFSQIQLVNVQIDLRLLHVTNDIYELRLAVVDHDLDSLVNGTWLYAFVAD